MSNIITLNKDTSVSEYLQMSNGLTSVFINAFGLSGSRLAKTEIEKRLIVWVLEKNQSIFGMGTVGFEICDMPWGLESFEENKAFILSVLGAMKNKLGWELLEYSPNEEMLFPCVAQFEKLLSKMESADIHFEEIDGWVKEASSDDPIFNGFPKCPRHSVLLSIFGCQVCTD